MLCATIPTTRMGLVALVRYVADAEAAALANDDSGHALACENRRRCWRRSPRRLRCSHDRACVIPQRQASKAPGRTRTHDPQALL
jgi:hypothetical protein